MSIHRFLNPARALTIVAASLVGCGDSGSYELTWSIGCDKVGEPGCLITSVRQCASAGVDAVAVVAKREGEQDTTRTLFACYGSDGPVGRGPGLAEGPTELSVSGLSAGGQTVSGPVAVTVTIPGDGIAPVGVDLPQPLACRDGVDNDGDGLVDLLDPGCADVDDDDESQ